MSGIDKVLKDIRANPKHVRFQDLVKLCTHFFGEPRNKGGSHHVYKMPWGGDPRVVLQDSDGMAKGYQVRQALVAIEHLKEVSHER